MIQLEYLKAMEFPAKDKASKLTFYNYPSRSSQHIRTTNPFELVFAAVRLKTTKTKNDQLIDARQT
ncbi:MAG: hypothetical protein DU489_15700 [Nitrosomonas sp.]